ncbi:MAG TPA: PEGA domain-containing protein, partial [Vicinamibacterales bacterium]|nr:PEGA domain-containing protein [Vicinamibacterales bacterium]
AVDAATGDLLQILRVRPQLLAVPSFEFALRERAARLANFRHAYYARVRRIDRHPSGLAIVSDHVEGVRLSEMLRVAHARGLRLDLSAGLCLLRQLVPSIALLHENARDVAHGLVAPERLIVTPRARLVVVEHVLGSSVEQLQFKRERLWQELRVAVPPAAGAIRFDHRADVAAIGVTALSLVLGRPLADDEYPNQAATLLAGARARGADGEDQPLPEALQTWIGRALQLDLRQGFASATDAQIALEDALADDSGFVAAPVALETFLSRYIAAMLEPVLPEKLSVKPAVAVVPPVFSPAAAAMPPAPPVRVSPAPPAPPAPAAVPLSPAAAAAVTLSPAAAAMPPAPPIRLSPAPVAPPVPPAPVAAAPAPVALPVAPAPTPLAASAAPAVPVAPKPVAAPVSLTLDPPTPARPAPMPLVTVAPVVPVAAPPAAPVPVAIAPPVVAAPAPRDITELLKDFDLPPVPAAAHEVEPAAAIVDPDARPRAARWRRIAVIALATAALGEGALIAVRAFNKPAAPVLGSLSVQTNPPGVAVFVDGVARGNTPARVSLNAGSHILELRGRGVPRVIPVTVTAGAEASQYLELPATPSVGSLLVQSDPTGARVTIDGVDRGSAPASVSDLAPGEHDVVLQAEGGTPVRQKVVIQAGVTASILAPVTTASAGPVSGWVSVKSPVTIEIREGGRMIGSSDTDRIMMAAGRHDVELVNETLGYRVTRTIQVPPGKVSAITLEMPQGTINLNAAPWADVFIDGRHIGETPIGNLSLPIGPHEILFRHPQLGEKRQAVSVTLNAPVRLSVDMK